MISIKQNSSFSARRGGGIPDFRNLGVCLRTLLLVNLMALIAAILESTDIARIGSTLAEISAFMQPILLLSLLILYVASPLLRKMPYAAGVIFILLATLGVTSTAHYFSGAMLGLESIPPLASACLLTLIVTGITLHYFNLRHRALSPAITEARLQALQARIRPHFLFNSINAVLSLMRSNPKRAETALEDLADLFRVLMADNRDLVPLAQELALSRQYLALEKLRLDERLHISWQIDNMPPDALIPPLVLQPLLENAVYHGIEPLHEGGEIIINIYTERNAVHVVLSNPYTAKSSHQHQNGNKMALTNIRERLALHFDAEAQLSTEIKDGVYQVHIVVPYRGEMSA